MRRACNINTINLIISLLLLTVLFYSCTTGKPALDPKDLSYLYNPTKNPVNPSYNIINISQNKSTLSVKFFARELMFSEANPQGVPAASMLVTVKLYDITSGMTLADTAAYTLNIVKEKDKEEYIYTIPLNVKEGNQYVAEAKILDKMRSLVMQSFIPFNTESLTGRYNYRAQGHISKSEVFNSVLRVGDYVNLVYQRGNADSMYVAFYKPFTVKPDPPSMILPEKTIDYGPDTIVALPYSDTLSMMFPKPGIYLCSIDSNATEGYSFFNFGPTFPDMNQPEVMLEPLTYLATDKEMDEMRLATRPKLALDEFWIKCGGNVEKARELIRIYYTRVVYANYYFTSYKEGWRTERGMIYLIYGPPDKVYKNPDGESWGYRKPVIKSSWGTRYKVEEEYLYFNFKKKKSAFTDNDYFLSRSESLITFWEQAVASWRRGIVFRLDNPEGI